MAAPTGGGFKMSLGSLKVKPGLKASLLQKETKRPRLALDEDELDDSNKQEEIIGWDAAEGGAVDAKKKEEKQGPRIIPALPDRDWRLEARQKQLAKAPHQQVQETKETIVVEEQKIQYGLTIIKRNVVPEPESTEPVATEPEDDGLTDEQRLEKKALDALLNGKPADNGLVIPVQTEEDAFLHDVENAPDAPTLEAYEATPIEGFGAAMLRGMGWKDDDATGKNGAAAKPQVTKRRPALLGIGAEDEAATGVELGEFAGGGGKGKGKKIAQAYNPVALRNKHTGEVITEEELKAKLENQEMVKEDEPEKRRRKYDDEKEESDGRRERRRERRDDRDRDRDRRRDDYYDSDRRRDKRSTRDDDYDSERRRDKRRDRSRDNEYDSERRRDKRRERSRSPDSKKARDRDRYRSRSRDSKRRRERRDVSEDSGDRRKRRKERDYEYEDRKSKHRDDKYCK